STPAACSSPSRSRLRTWFWTGASVCAPPASSVSRRCPCASSRPRTSSSTCCGRPSFAASSAPRSGRRSRSSSAGSASCARRRALRGRGLPVPAPLPEGPFERIDADPPWQLGNPDGPYAPESHYPTMALAEITALPVPAGEDAVLFLWAISSLLPEALDLVEAWGFEYKSALVWVKDRIGPGVWPANR